MTAEEDLAWTSTRNHHKKDYLFRNHYLHQDQRRDQHRLCLHLDDLFTIHHQTHPHLIIPPTILHRHPYLSSRTSNLSLQRPGDGRGSMVQSYRMSCLELMMGGLRLLLLSRALCLRRTWMNLIIHTTPRRLLNRQWREQILKFNTSLASRGYNVTRVSTSFNITNPTTYPLCESL